MTTGPLPAPLKCKSGQFNVPRVMKTVSSYGYHLWCGFKWVPHHASNDSLEVVERKATSCHLTSSKSAWKSTPKCTWMCWRVWWSPGAIKWPVADPGCGSRTRRRPTSPKRPRLCFRRSAKTLYPPLTGLLSFPDQKPTGLLCLVIYREHHQHDLPQDQSQLDHRYSTRSRQCLWKRHAPSSGSVLRWWLGLKAATLNRCQLYYIIKLSELIFFNKSFKIKL